MERISSPIHHLNKLPLKLLMGFLIDYEWLLLGTSDYSVPMPWITQGACKSILGSLNLSQINKYSKIIWIPQKSYIQRIKSHTFDSDVLRSIPIDVDNSKVVMDLVNSMIFHPMTLPCIQELRWRRSQGGGQGSLSRLQGENDKTWEP